MRIILLIGNPVRDLAGMILLGRELCCNGATCYLLAGARRNDALQLEPDFVLLDNFRKSRSELASALLKRNIAVGVLDAEGGVLPSIQWYEDALSSDEQKRKQLKFFFSWGERMAKEAVERNWFLPQQVYLTGHPRFDFYADNFVHLRLPDSPDSQQFSNPIVLISGRYALANPADGSSQDKAELVAKIRRYDPPRAAQWIDAQRRGLEAMCELTTHLVQHFPEVDFIYRPHPFERLESYREYNWLPERANLIINREGMIGDWLDICNALIHRGCTTAIEAGMRDVAALSPRWIPVADEIESSESVSIGCQSVEDVEKLIAHVTQGNKIERPADVRVAYDKVIQDWFYRIDGQSHKRIAQTILSVGEAHITPHFFSKCKNLFNRTSTFRDNSSNELKWLSYEKIKAIDTALYNFNTDKQKLNITSIHNGIVQMVPEVG